VLAVAACVGLAFFLGVVARGRWTESGDNTRGQLAVTGAATDDYFGHRDEASVYSAGKPSITMAVVDHQGDVERQFELPVVEADQLSPGWLARRPAAVSQQAVEALEDSGFRVDQVRFYVPVVLDDGRAAIVSLDRATVKYGGIQY
jgi:hypothetical protein